MLWSNSKKWRAELVASVIVLGVTAFLLNVMPPEPSQKQVIQVADKPAAPAPIRLAQSNIEPKQLQQKTAMHKKLPTKKPVKIEPYVVASNDLLVSFPEPTPISIELAGKPSYVKLSYDQQELEDSASNWNCVVDKNSGLTWEKKTSDRGLRDAQNFYSWYNPNELTNGGFSGVADSGKCRGGIDCDTHAYITAVNEMKLCGYSDWRLPSRSELMSLVQYSARKAGKGMIDSRYFPGATSDWYWAADTNYGDPEYAWYVLYFNGKSLRARKGEAKRIRLVRSSKDRSIQNLAKGPTTIAKKVIDQGRI
jgi:hypothetical protein